MIRQQAAEAAVAMGPDAKGLGHSRTGQTLAAGPAACSLQRQHHSSLLLVVCKGPAVYC